MRQLIAALGDNIKESGMDKWVARCPVHNDKDFAMSIKVNGDNSIVAHCFACGANGLDLYKELELDLDELFGGKKLNSTYMPKFISDQYEQDLVAIDIYKTNTNIKYSLADKKRYKLALARSKGIKDKYGL